MCAQKSVFWQTSTAGDGSSEYTQTEVIQWQREEWIGDDTVEGVFIKPDPALLVSGTASPINIGTGAACVYGFHYWNTSNVSTAIPTPSSATRRDLIVLEADWSARTVRLARVAGTEGAAAPAVTQTDGVTWQILLAQCNITTGGAITVVDYRNYLHPNIRVDTENIDDDAIDSQHYADGSIDTAHIADAQITAAKLATNSVTSSHITASSVTTAKIANDAVDDTKVGNRVPQLYRRQGGSASNWSTQGTTDYTPTTVRMQVGCKRLVFSTNSTTAATVTFPQAFSNVPTVWIQCANSNGFMAYGTPTSSNFLLSSQTIDGSSVSGNYDFFWLAIGPE